MNSLPVNAGPITRGWRCGRQESNADQEILLSRFSLCVVPSLQCTRAPFLLILQKPCVHDEYVCLILSIVVIVFEDTLNDDLCSSTVFAHISLNSVGDLKRTGIISWSAPYRDEHGIAGLPMCLTAPAYQRICCTQAETAEGKSKTFSSSGVIMPIFAWKRGIFGESCEKECMMAWRIGANHA